VKQVVKLFVSYDGSVDTYINKFLEEHPDYIIDKITFAFEKSDRALIVFKVKEPTCSRAVGFTHFGETKIIKYEDKKSEYPRCNRCINNLKCFGQKDYQGNCEDFQDVKDWEITCSGGNNNG
jgi:hypothetical protein